MPVYVDNLQIQYGRMKMCHMWADTLDELHAMADKIGIQRKWFQCPPKASWNHYDVSLAKMREAISNGAIMTDRYGAAYFNAIQRGNMKMMLSVEEIRKRRSK